MKVLVLTLDGTGERRELASGTLSVGRAADNDWVLTESGPDHKVSRRHCRFTFGADGASVTDLGSTNGTLMNGRALPPRVPTPLRGGEVLAIGNRRLRVELMEPSQRAAALPAPLFAGLDAPLGPTGPDEPTAPPPLRPRPGPPAGRPDAILESPGPPDLFAGEGVPSPSLGLIREDPLAGVFSEELRRQPYSGSSTPLRERPKPGGDAPQLGALPTRAPPSSQAADAKPAVRPEPGLPAAATEGVAPLLADFLDGAGLGAGFAKGQDPVTFLRDAGRVFALLANGLRELLAVRAVIKGQAGVDRTGISATLNNPLKLSVTGREATAALLGGREEGYLSPAAAVDAGFRDLKAHELAVLEGVRSAVEELLGLFDPVALERKLGDPGTLATLMQGGRRGLLWELYQERYAEIAKSARTRFMGRLDDAFRAAYTRKSAEVSAQVPPGPSSGVPRQ